MEEYFTRPILIAPQHINGPTCSNFWELAVYSASLPDHPPLLPPPPLPPETNDYEQDFGNLLTWGFEGPAREPSGTVGASPSFPSVSSARILSTSLWCENSQMTVIWLVIQKYPPDLTWTSSSSSSSSPRPSIVSSSISSIIPALNVILEVTCRPEWTQVK